MKKKKIGGTNDDEGVKHRISAGRSSRKKRWVFYAIREF